MRVVQNGKSHSVTAACSATQGVKFVHLLRLVDCKVQREDVFAFREICKTMTIQFYIRTLGVYVEPVQWSVVHVHVLYVYHCLD